MTSVKTSEKSVKKTIFFLLILFFAISGRGWAITRSLTYNGSALSTAVNTLQTVAQHTSDITLSTPVDYVITASEGQTAMTARVNIAHGRAAVVFENIRPSEVIGSWLKFITVNGAQATDGNNCRVETYRHGTIVLPYSLMCHPLTVYKGTASQGESNSEYEVNTYYDRLGNFDNAINSFTLKRGYMVTMANHADGTGYSHCFIANDGDITVTLPKDMRNSVSFLRILRWRWPSKKGYAGRTPTPMGLMRVTWFYQWNAENYVESNYDYVPQRHHETGSTYSGNATWAWPSWDALNSQTSAHVLGTNEPDNTSGSEMYMTVDNLIRLHADYLRSGMRIGTFACCNPNTSWVKAYVDSCEAHNYRVDFVATHYYIGGQTPAACVASLKSLYDATGLPVWCTEWNNGANWTSESQFYTDTKGAWYRWGSGNDQEMNGIWLTDVLRRADYSENTEWLERMAVYNNVEQKRYVHWITDDLWTTAGGDIYGAYNSDFAYRKTTDVWMNWRDQGDPRSLFGGYAADGEHLYLQWTDPNTDWTKTVYVQQQASGSVWSTRATLGVSDEATRNVTLAVNDCSGKKVFRIACVDANGKYHYSNTIDLTATDIPNGYMKITSLPGNSEDFYYVVADKASGLCWTLDNANPTDDYTSIVGTSKSAWNGASGTVTGNGIELVELYNSASAGIKMQQTVTVPNGIYKAVLYATSHNARGENGATLNGTRDNVAYVFATSSGTTQKTYFTASGVTPGFLTGEPLECTISNIRVTDSSLTLGLGLDQANITGWHCIQIKSLTRTGDVEGVQAGASAFKAVHYAEPSPTGTHLAQVWQMEPNDVAGGYVLRCPAQYDFVLCGTQMHTDNKTHLATATNGFLPVYDSSNDCWRIKYAANDTYCGVDGTPAVGDEVSAGKTVGHADQLAIYAVRKSDFNQWYIVDNQHADASYTIANPNLSWGTAVGGTSGGGRVEYPVRWNFQHRFEGWNDAFTGTAALSDGHVGTFFNAWAGTLNYAELSQEVRHLPNGVYRLTADFATTDGYSRTTSKTALYANAGEGNISRSYNITGTGDNDFNLYTCYVLVKDNRMTVGARSDGTWFKVADFHLEYVCAENEATEDILGWLDNGRALQHQCWRMGDAWLDLSGFPDCRNLQVDQIADNALIKMAPGATVDAAYHPNNIIQDGKCTLLVITDEAPLEVLEPFEASEVRYERHDGAGEWHPLFLPFAVPSSSEVKVAGIEGVDGKQLRCLLAKESLPNRPALVKFDNAAVVLEGVSVLPTVEYDNEETRQHGTYRDGGTCQPLRWYVEGADSLSDLTLIFIGDVNRDGRINVADVMGLVTILLEKDNEKPYRFDHDAANFNGDATISVTDVMQMVNYILNADR